MSKTKEHAAKGVAAQKAAPKMTNEIAPELKGEGFKIANPEIFFWKPYDGEVLPGQALELDKVNVLRGIIIDRQQRPEDLKDDGRDGPRYYFRVAVTADCVLYTHEGEAVQASHGIFAWVDERHDLQSLALYLPRRKDGTHELSSPIVEVTEVILTPQRKIKLRKRAQGMWKIQVLNRSIAAAAAGVPLLAPPVESEVETTPLD
jgi:hypothetical protein